MSALLFDTSAILAHHLEEEGWEQVENLFLKPEQTILKEYCKFCVDVVAVDESIAHLAIVLRESASARLPLADSLIAACAKQREATLVHRDPHFRAISPNDLKQIELLPKAKVS